MSMTRRTVMGTLATGVAAPGLTRAANAAEVNQPATSIAPFKAAVMRVPVLVPPSIDALNATRDRNAADMVAAIETVMKTSPKPRVVVFPVLQYTSSSRATSGIPISGVAIDLTEKPLDQTWYKPVIEACRRHNCYVATSTQEKSVRMPGKYFHTGFIMGPEGLVLRSPKTQAPSAPEMFYLRDMGDEYEKFYGPGSILPVVQTPIGRLACYVEAEAEVLEVSRLLAAKGAEIILHTSLEGDEVPWVGIKQAIGYQCHVYLLTAATSRIIYAKDPAGDWRGGSSTIVGPDGRVLASKGGREEGFAIADIDLAQIDVLKKKNGPTTTPAWGLYSGLYKK